MSRAELEALVDALIHQVAADVEDGCEEQSARTLEIKDRIIDLYEAK